MGRLEQKPNFRDVLEMVRGGFFLRKKPLDGSDSPYTRFAFALVGLEGFEPPAKGYGFPDISISPWKYKQNERN